MPSIKVVNMAGKEVGEITLSDKVFGADVNETVLHTAVRAYLMNQRQGTQSTEENGSSPVLRDRCPSASRASYRRRILPNG